MTKQHQKLLQAKIEKLICVSHGAVDHLQASNSTLRVKAAHDKVCKAADDVKKAWLLATAGLIVT